MLKIVYPICCGIDIHKLFIVACIASTNDKGVTTPFYSVLYFSLFDFCFNLILRNFFVFKL